MRRWVLRSFAGLVVLLAAASPAQAHGHPIFHPYFWVHPHQWHQYKQGYGYPGGQAQPITPGQIIAGIQLAQSGFHLFQGLVRDLRGGQDGSSAEPAISREVFESIGRSDATLQSAVEKTNALLKSVRAGDTRYDEKSLPNVTVVQPGTGTAVGGPDRKGTGKFDIPKK